MPDRMISLKNVSAGYGKYKAGNAPEEALVLKDLSFEITQGSSVCLLGQNGCGKTTLLRVIAGMLPARGEVLVDGRNIKELRRKEIASYMSFLSQMTRVYYSYSVFETVMHGRYVHGSSFFSGTELIPEFKERDPEYPEILRKACSAGFITDLDRHRPQKPGHFSRKLQNIALFSPACAVAERNKENEKEDSKYNEKDNKKYNSYYF